MKKTKKAVMLVCVICAAVTALSFLPSFASADNDSDNETCEYVYTINIKVSNPCNSSDMDKDAVNTLYFDYYYIGKNGFGNEEKQTFDMSWNGSANENSDFLKEHFIRPNDNSYNTSFDVSLRGKLNKVYFKLNMDGGERLSFTVESIMCAGKRINSNTDYVSSAYNDSTATVYCSMERSVIDETLSPYFETHESFGISEKEMNAAINGMAEDEDYVGQFKDQYGSVIDMTVLKNCIESSDGDINQSYSHHDEESMYLYTFCFCVDNPIDLTYADYNEVETFYIEMTYTDNNGYGTQKKYTLDMKYDSGLKRNLNKAYLEHFERNNDDSYKTQFSVWVPGILTEVNCKLNMRGEKLSVTFEKILLGGVAVNTNRDYVSSVYYDSDAKIKCSVPAPRIAVNTENLPETYSAELTDQYGARVSENLFAKAQENPKKYLYFE